MLKYYTKNLHHIFQEEKLTMKQEIELILLSVLRNKTEEEISRITELINSDLNWVYIGGILINHRLSGYFINGLNNEQAVKVPKELLKTLKLLIKAQVERQALINKEIDIIDKKLRQTDIRFAGLKGVLLGTEVYVNGDRRSNDVDLLVYEEDLDKLDKAMREMGYIQSNCPNSELIEASKKEKIIQRMNYHDLVPYVKQIDDIVLEVDINFLFDGKDNQIDKQVYEDGLFVYYGNAYSITGLSQRMNLAFFIVHFYREATNSIWTNEKRDIVFYKIVDTMNYIRHVQNKIDRNELVEVFKKLNIAGKAYYVFNVLREFYNNEFITNMLSLLDEFKNNDLGNIYIVEQKKYIKRENSFFYSVFCEL